MKPISACQCGTRQKPHGDQKRRIPPTSAPGLGFTPAHIYTGFAKVSLYSYRPHRRATGEPASALGVNHICPGAQPQLLHGAATSVDPPHERLRPLMHAVLKLTVCSGACARAAYAWVRAAYARARVRPARLASMSVMFVDQSRSASSRLNTSWSSFVTCPADRCPDCSSLDSPLARSFVPLSRMFVPLSRMFVPLSRLFVRVSEGTGRDRPRCAALELFPQ